MTRPDLEYISVSANDLATLIAERASSAREAREALDRFGELQKKHGSLRLSLIVRLGFTAPVSDDELIQAAERAWRVAQGVAEGTLVDEAVSDA
jgi:hypothetical protein